MQGSELAAVKRNTSLGDELEKRGSVRMDRDNLMGNVVVHCTEYSLEQMGRKTVWDRRGAGYPDLQARGLAQFGARFIGRRYAARMPVKQGKWMEVISRHSGCVAVGCSDHLGL
jgi:hypothetical protein